MQQSSTSVCYLELLLFLISVIEICFWNFNINSVTCHYFVNELEKQKFQNSSRTDTILISKGRFYSRWGVTH